MANLRLETLQNEENAQRATEQYENGGETNVQLEEFGPRLALML